MFLSTHTGTHIDAPAHFVQNSKTIDELDVSRFVTHGVLLRFPKDADQQITLDDIINYEINANDTVILATGWENQHDKDNYMSNNPGLSAEAAEYLANIKVNAVAIDGPSIDRGIDNRFDSHSILLSNDIFIIEKPLQPRGTGRCQVIYPCSQSTEVSRSIWFTRSCYWPVMILPNR
jgi:arylformamidase